MSSSCFRQLFHRNIGTSPYSMPGTPLKAVAIGFDKLLGHFCNLCTFAFPEYSQEVSSVREMSFSH
ncbi:conserved protein of unknown function [Limnospira indica PCC 8005]|uniref:Uncharacterized protein n=1 Tax=Limnospira indica PCC 8005 TaxID=376219 RepID=A0A9P1KFT4_9CYAN|nr:conserved protein of unknown function [Limnospira indica PCC 8005]